MPHTFTGGCHCGAVRFKVTLDTLEALDCNCSICRLKGFLHAIVPTAQFELETDPAALTTYTFNTHVAKHTFCATCGVHSFYTPRSHPDQVDVNVRCLDAPLERFEIVPFDGDRWEENVASIGGVSHSDGSP